MGYPLSLALRYLRSKKRASISVGTMFAILGVALGVAALATVMSVTGGFQAQFREKVLGVNAHVLVLKYSTEFRDYRDVMKKVESVPGVVAVAPFSINPMMLTHGDATATGVLLKGVDPTASLGVDSKGPPVLDLPRHIIEGESGACSAEGDLACGIKQLRGLRREGAKPAERKIDSSDYDDPFEPPQHGSSGGGAEPERDDAGMPVDLKKQILKDIEKGDARRKATAPDAADWEPVPSEEPDAGEDDIVDAGPDAPVGSVAPDGGYKSVLPDDDELPPELSTDACSDPERVKDMPGIVIGVSLAKTLSLKIGDCVTVTSPTIGYQWSGGTVRPPVAKSFKVKAIFEAGFDQYDSKLVYTDLYEAQSFYDQGDTVTGVEMKIADIDKADDVVRDVTNALASKSYHIMDWKELNHGLFTALLIQQIGMSAVLALIILVAAFTVVATLIMVVLDKKREIAVLKAMGATDWAILRVFLYQGGIIGTAGTGFGLALGLLVCKGLIRYAFPLDPKVYFISHLPVLVRPFEFIVTGGVAVVLCLTATILPSLYAAGIRPADGFREQ
jgi:lipoprotein-releasing system permease protein